MHPLSITPRPHIAESTRLDAEFEQCVSRALRAGVYGFAFSLAEL
jgi:hypothetical protein